MFKNLTSAPLMPPTNDVLFKGLGHLGFQRFAPHAHLQPWVQCYWIAQQQRPSDATVNETVYPDGGTTLVFDFSRSDFPDVTFFATQRVGKMIFHGPVHRMGIRFHPGGAFQLLKLGMPEVIGGELSADDLAVQSLLQLRDQLAELTHLSQRLALIDEWLLELANLNSLTTGVIQQLLPQLLFTQESAAHLTIEQLSAHLSISRRQLERKFQLEVGCSPIQLKQLHRIKIARTLISQRPEQSLSEIGQDAGFYDQAHFIHHFHKITGQTPGEYRQRKMSQTYNSGKP